VLAASACCMLRCEECTYAIPRTVISDLHAISEMSILKHSPIHIKTIREKKIWPCV
jgi:hypothetical protein